MRSEEQVMDSTPTKKDDLRWYPMRIAYGRNERMFRIKEMLDDIGLENFMPLSIYYERTSQQEHEQKVVPAIHGLIFVRSSQERLTELKMTNTAFSAMRYMTNRFSTASVDPILTVPDRQMENFIHVVSTKNERVRFLEYNTEFMAKPGRRVRITDGDFKGAEGVIKRIKKHRCVVVQIEGVAAVAITFVPTAWIEEIKVNE